MQNIESLVMSEPNVEITVSDSDSPSKKIVTISCIPGRDTSHMFMGYYEPGKYAAPKEIEMDYGIDGQYIANITMSTTEASNIFLFAIPPGVDINLRDDSTLVDKRNLALVDGALNTDVNRNPALTDEQRGTLQTRILNTDGSLGYEQPYGSLSVLQEGQFLVDIYLPPGYDAQQQYPINIMLDGDAHLDSDPFGNRMETQHNLDNMIAAGKIPPTIAVFHTPTPPTPDGKGGYCAMPRLREYACDYELATSLASIPEALIKAKMISQNAEVTITGQSMGGLQAIYTAKMFPDIFSNVIALSPAAWWGPSQERLDKAEPGTVRFADDASWRAPLDNKAAQNYLLKMITTNSDGLTGQRIPQGSVKCFIQAGTGEMGDDGNEPLTPAAINLARALNARFLGHDGGHLCQAWAAGLSTAMQEQHLPASSNKLLLFRLQQHTISSFNQLEKNKREEAALSGLGPKEFYQLGQKERVKALA